MDRQTESQIHWLRVGWRNLPTLRVGWRNLFPVVLLCQILVPAGNRFWLYILLCTWSTIQLWCCVSFFGSGGKKVFGVTYILSVQYSCAVVSVFLLWRESFITTGKKINLVIYLAGCAVVSVFGSGRK